MKIEPTHRVQRQRKRTAHSQRDFTKKRSLTHDIGAAKEVTKVRIVSSNATVLMCTKSDIRKKYRRSDQRPSQAEVYSFIADVACPKTRILLLTSIAAERLLCATTTRHIYCDLKLLCFIRLSLKVFIREENF